MEVISDVLLKVSHEEMASEVVHQVILVEIAPHHGEEPSTCLISLIRKKTYETRKVHSTIESHQYKNLGDKTLSTYIFRNIFFPYLVEHFGTDFEGSVTTFELRLCPCFSCERCPQ